MHPRYPGKRLAGLILVPTIVLSACSRGDAPHESATGPSSAATSEVTSEGFRLELVVDDVPVVVEGAGGVADAGAAVSARGVTRPVEDPVLRDEVGLPAVEVALDGGGQPRTPVTITYDVSGRSDVLDAVSRGGAPLVVSDEGDEASRGLVTATVDPATRTLVARTPHLSTFRPAVVDLGGKFSAAWKRQQEVRAGAGATAECPQPDGVDVGGKRARAQSSAPDVVDACVTGADGDDAVLGLTNLSPLFFTVDGVPAGGVGTREVPDSAELLAALFHGGPGGAEKTHLLPPSSRSEARIPTVDLPTSLQVSVDPASTQYETVLTGLDMLGVKAATAEAALAAKSALDCGSAASDTTQRPGADADEWSQRLTTFGDCLLKASAAAAGTSDSAAVHTLGTALSLVGTLPRQLRANLEGAAGEFRGKNRFDISILTGTDAAAVDRDAAGPGAPGDQRSPESGPGWYWLTDIEPANWENGLSVARDRHDTIKNTRYPNSIYGWYTTGKAYGDPDRATYMLAGKCTSFDVHVGQSANSRDVAGPGRFRVWKDDATLLADEYVAMNEEAHHLQIDLTGASRLTIQDDRDRLGGFNVWGSPRVYCSENPSPKR